MVATVRATLKRPSSPAGDPEAEERLLANLLEDAPEAEAIDRKADFKGLLELRTRFFDAVVTEALASGIAQVVILGAGYDGRALRFRTPGVRFFEVDHPNTQRDKRERLAAVHARTDDLTFVAFDFNQPGLAEVLAKSGLVTSARCLFLCEGLLRYLPEPSFRGLLAVTAKASGPGSIFAASIATRIEEEDEVALERRQDHERRLADAGEAVLTVPEASVVLRWITEAGWSVPSADDFAAEAPGPRRGYLLVQASH
ncbi:MAG TPA: SAM-dependent methyltransferase [Polyangia bacterium]